MGKQAGRRFREFVCRGSEAESTNRCLLDPTLSATTTEAAVMAVEGTADQNACNNPTGASLSGTYETAYANLSRGRILVHCISKIKLSERKE